MTKVDSNTILEHQLKPAKNKTFQHKTSKNETFEHKTAKSKTVKTLHNKTLETTKSSNEIREQFSNIEEGVGRNFVIFNDPFINEVTLLGGLSQVTQSFMTAGNTIHRSLNITV